MISRGSRRYARWWFGLLNWSAPVLDPGEDPHGSVDLDGIPVDVGIAKLVEGLWDQGYETWGSCQGDPVLYRMSRCDFETMAYLTLATEHVIEWVTQQDVDLARRITEIAADHKGLFPIEGVGVGV